jgi:hypothetical protein
MSKIQAVFNTRGRRLFESEKSAVEAFNAKYAHADLNATIRLSSAAASIAVPGQDQVLEPTQKA